jgi:hypothetical protein
MNEYEIKVTITSYVNVDAYNKEQAIEQAKQIVAETYNGTASDEATYEMTSRLCESCNSNELEPEDGRLCESCRHDWKESDNQ